MAWSERRWKRGVGSRVVVMVVDGEVGCAPGVGAGERLPLNRRGSPSLHTGPAPTADGAEHHRTRRRASVCEAGRVKERPKNQAVCASGTRGQAAATHRRTETVYISNTSTGQSNTHGTLTPPTS